MNEMDLLDACSTVRFLDQTDLLEHTDALWNHAMDEAIAHAVAKGIVPATVRCWRYDRAVMLGRRDMRLPHMDEAIEWMRTQGYDVAVRPCGGTGVPLDLGVLNISIILPATDYTQVSLDDGFQVMAQLIATSLQTLADVKAGEVPGSYCPGDYDLSISGYKIAGIAQRRIMGAVMVQAFLLVHGSGEQHFQLIKTMYERAGLYQAPVAQRPVPLLRQNSIRSVQEMVLHQVHPQQVTNLILETLQGRINHVARGMLTTAEMDMTKHERERFSKQLQLVCLQRYNNLEVL